MELKYYLCLYQVGFVSFVIWNILEFLVFVVWDTLCAILKLIVKLSKTIWNILLCGLYNSVKLWLTILKK